MGWGPVTNIGIATGSGATLTVTPSSAVPAGSLIIIGAQDNGGAAIGSSQIADSAGNSYTLILSTINSPGAMAAWFSTNANGISTSQTITYTKINAINGGCLTTCYVSNAQGFKLDSGVTATAIGTSSTPSVTSNLPKDNGEIFFALASEDTVALSLSQDSGHGWSAPPNEASGGSNDLMGGSKIPTSRAAQTFSPGSTASVAWTAGIFSFQQGNILSYYESLSEPVRFPRPLSPHLKFVVANSNYYGIPGQLLTYFPPLTEPARSLPPLPLAGMPFIAQQINYIQYSFALSEMFDRAIITINDYTTINSAQVGITEVNTDTAKVAIRAINLRN